MAFFLSLVSLQPAVFLGIQSMLLAFIYSWCLHSSFGFSFTAIGIMFLWETHRDFLLHFASPPRPSFEILVETSMIPKFRILHPWKISPIRMVQSSSSRLWIYSTPGDHDWSSFWMPGQMSTVKKLPRPPEQAGCTHHIFSKAFSLVHTWAYNRYGLVNSWDALSHLFVLSLRKYLIHFSGHNLFKNHHFLSSSFTCIFQVKLQIFNILYLSLLSVPICHSKSG